MAGMAVNATLWAWLALEIGLLVRDRVRRQGGSARDRGTRTLNIWTIAGAVILAEVVAWLLRDQTAARLPGTRWPLVAGLAVMWAGLAVRIWAVAVLGRSFRTTVEVDPDQAVVDRGPYRWVRHPSYTGVVLILLGLGLALANWVSLAIAVLPPLAVLARRITVEEAAIVETLGQPYREYQARTRWRLAPGVW